MYNANSELNNDFLAMHLSKRGASEQHRFVIQHGSDTFEVQLPGQSTVQDLGRAVAQRVKVSPGNRFVCLESSNKHELIDYALMRRQQRLTIFRKNEVFRTYVTDYDEQGSRPALSDFVFLKCLGQGGSASVYLVRRKVSGQLYALKQIDKEYFIEFKRMEQILRQKKILSELISDFPFVAQLHCSFESERHLNFLLEYYPGGELFLHLQRRRFSEHEARLYFCEIVLTFEHLHKNRIIYRDLKPENIMIDWEGHTKLADFGLCKLNLTREEYTHSFCGSLEYMAPEVRDSQGYNYSVDFYTMGAFLYEMIIGVPPYYNNQPLYFPEKVSKSLMELIKGLIDKDLDKRINSFSVVKSSSWLSGVSWSDIFNKRYEMPIKLSIYDSYVHDEFTKVKVDSMNLIKEEKFDRLFDMFYYNREPRKSTLFDRPTKLISPDAFKKSKSKSKSRRSNKSKEDLMAKSKTRKSTSRDRSHDRDPSKGKPKLQTQTTYVQQQVLSKIPRVASPLGRFQKKINIRN